MDQIVQFIIAHSQYTVWITFGLVLLAGLGLPVSIDVIMVLAAFLAATTIPDQYISIYFSLLIGCYLSSWIAYWVGRTLGLKLLKFRIFSKILNEKKLQQIQYFYEKHGMLTLVLGRFIPFGIRNCIFMSTGISRFNFIKFIKRDALACLVWTTTSFFTYYAIGQNINLLIKNIKILNLFIFFTFSVAVITFLCYKKYRKKRLKKFAKNIDLKQ